MRLPQERLQSLEIIGTASELQQLRKRPRILMITNDPDHAKVVINIRK